MTKPKPATLADVARIAGVSRQTVSNVLNSREIVASETAMRVDRAIRQLGYKPNPLARSLRTGTSPIVALRMAPIESDAAEQAPLRQAMTWAAERRLLVLPYEAPPSAVDEAELVSRMVAQWRPVAILRTDDNMLGSEVDAMLSRLDVPVLPISSLRAILLNE